MVLALAFAMLASAEDGSRLWLRYDEVNKAQVTGPQCLAADELRQYYTGAEVRLALDPSVVDDEGYVIEGSTIKAKTER